MTVLEIVEMLRAGGERAAEHTSERLSVDIQITSQGLLLIAALNKPHSSEGRPLAEAVCTGEISWDEIPECDATMMRKFVDEVVSGATDDRKEKRKARGRNKKGNVIYLFPRTEE